MRRLYAVAALVAAFIFSPVALAQEVPAPASPGASSAPAGPSAPSPFSVPQPVAAPTRRTKTVVEYALVRGRGDGEQGLFSHEDPLVVQLHKLDMVRQGQSLADVRLVRRTCTYPLAKFDPATGKAIDVEMPQAKGSEVIEEDMQ